LSPSQWLNEYDPEIGFGGGGGTEWSMFFELREAARFSQIPWMDFKDMPKTEQARSVAHRRAYRMLERINQRRSEMRR